MKRFLFLFFVTVVITKSVTSIQTECTSGEVQSCLQTVECHEPGYHVVCRMKKMSSHPGHSRCLCINNGTGVYDPSWINKNSFIIKVFE